jgi:hypothetical protein
MKCKHAAVCSGMLILLLALGDAQVCAIQSEGDEQNLAPRTLEVLDVGYKLPIEILAVRNLRKREHWLRDLEIEIKNVSGKPIYGVYFLLLLLDDKGPTGLPVGLNLEYGRHGLLHPKVHASAGDKAFGPGETIIIKAAKREWEGYEMRIANWQVPEQASYNLRMIITAITFGDGTGFINGGAPYPVDPPYVARPHRYVRIPADSK